MRKMGVPYPEGYENKAIGDMNLQAKEVAQPLYDNIDGLMISDETYDKIAAGEMKLEETEMVAIIAYLQRLGADIYPKAKK